MNQSDSPPDEQPAGEQPAGEQPAGEQPAEAFSSKHSPDSSGPSAKKTGERGAMTTEKQPFVATLVDAKASPPNQGHSEGGGDLREGSPFRQGSERPPHGEKLPSGPSYADLGPMRYTAMGAASAAVLVLIFASLGAWWFPAGGALVAVLGAVLSIVGLFARKKYRYSAIGALTLHVGLFMVSYVRSFS